MLLKQSTTRNFVFFMTLASDHISAATGKTVTVTISKDGAAFGAAAGTVTEISSGWYKVAFSTVDTNTLGCLAIHASATACDDTDDRCEIVADLPGATVSSVTGAVGSVTGNVGGNVNGAVVGAVASVTAAVTVGTNNDKTGYALSAAGLAAIWDRLTSALSTAGSIGKLLVDNIDAAISSRSTFAGGAVSSVTGNVGGNVVGSVGSVTAAVTVGTNNDKTGYALSSAGVDAILDDAPSAELTTLPTATSSLRLMTQYIFTYLAHKRTVTSAVETLYRANSSTSLGTSAITNDGSTLTKAKMS